MNNLVLGLVLIGSLCFPLSQIIASPVFGLDTPTTSPAFSHKPPPNWIPPAENPKVRQGGDTIEDAIPISLPFSSSGTTIGYSNDYWADCPYASWCPDVVYSFLPTSDMNIVVDLFGSDYDTKVFILDVDLQLIACNDDYYIPSYVSLLQMVTLTGGTQYYIIVDGYDGPGDYQISVLENQLDIPMDVMREGEPTLFEGYVDEYNSGCAFDSNQPLIQELIGSGSGILDFHGHLGYIGLDPFQADTDWISVVLGESGVIEVELSAQIESRLYHFAPTNCEAAEMVQIVSSRFGHPGSMSIVGEPFSVIWLVAIPDFHVPSGYAEAEYSYLLSFSGLAPGTVATETLPWGEIKSRYR